MRKHLSINSRMSWESTITSVNHVFIVLEASLSSVNPSLLSLYTSVTIRAYSQINYISVTFFMDHPYWSLWFLGISVNFRRHPYILQITSGNIRRNFLSLYWRGRVKNVADAIRRLTGAVRNLRTRHRLSTNQIQILITPDIHKPFAKIQAV